MTDRQKTAEIYVETLEGLVRVVPSFLALTRGTDLGACAEARILNDKSVALVRDGEQIVGTVVAVFWKNILKKQSMLFSARIWAGIGHASRVILRTNRSVKDFDNS